MLFYIRYDVVLCVHLYMWFVYMSYVDQVLFGLQAMLYMFRNISIENDVVIYE